MPDITQDVSQLLFGYLNDLITAEEAGQEIVAVAATYNPILGTTVNGNLIGTKLADIAFGDTGQDTINIEWNSCPDLYDDNIYLSYLENATGALAEVGSYNFDWELEGTSALGSIEIVNGDTIVQYGEFNILLEDYTGTVDFDFFM